MKKLISALLLTALIICCLPGVAFTVGADSLDRAMSTVKPELYGLYTLQSGNALRDKYDRAAALKAAGGTDNALALRLRGALDALVPLEDYGRIALGGFTGVSEGDIAAMKLCSGGVAAADGVITLSGEGALRYSNAAPGGIAGPSPFGADLTGADGFALKINASAVASLDLELGARGGDDDCVFTLSDVRVSAGERYYFFPFDRFGGLPLDETLNYVSLAFTGADEVSFGDLHAVRGALDPTKKEEYSGASVPPAQITPNGLYKIKQKDTGLALKMLDPEAENDACCVFAADDPDDDAQLWQIYPDAGSAMRFRFINKHYGVAFIPSATVFSAGRVNLTKPEQVWSVSYRNRGYAVTASDGKRFGYHGATPRLEAASSPIKYIDIVRAYQPEWTLAWSDEFDGTQVDRSVWHISDETVPGGENCYAFRDSPDNVYVEDGNLVIHTFKETYRNRPATSGHLRSEYAVDFGLGRYEFRSKLADGKGIFPAFWMMGEKDLWPRTAEIDIMEMVGTGPDDDWKGDKCSIATFHYAGEDGEHVEYGGYTDYGFLHTPEKLSEDYHVYAIEWESDQLRWYFDDLLYMTLNIDSDQLRQALQNNPMFLRINVALHGPGNYQLPEGMKDFYTYVDYVRYLKPAASAKPQNETYFNNSLTSPSYSFETWHPANGVAADPNGGRFVYGNGASVVKVIDVAGMKELGSKKISGETDWVKSAAISADGSTVAYGCTDSLILADARLSSLRRVSFASPTPVVALNADGSRLYAGGLPKDDSGFCDYLYTYDAGTAQLIRSEYTGSAVSCVTAAAGGEYAYGCYDGAVYVRSAAGEELGGFNAEGRIVSLAFSPDGGTVYASDGAHGIYSYSIASGEAALIARLGDEAYQLAVSPDGKRLAVACGDSCGRVYDIASGRLVARPCLGRLVVTNAAFSPDGRLLLLSGTDGAIGVYRADDGLPLARVSENGAPRWYNIVTVSADNSVLMSSRGVADFQSGAVAWKLPSGLIPEDGGDASALRELPYYDESAYTPESYAPYAAALKNAQAVAANRYSAQSVIDAALAAVNEAASALEEYVLRGDLDGDGEITVSDALAALRIAAKLADETPEAIAIGDTDGDGHITVSDALAILRAAVGLIKEL